MKRLVLSFLLISFAGLVSAQINYTFTDEDEWACYDAFNKAFLDASKSIYKINTETPRAVDRWNGAAAIWCQAIYYDMALNAYQRAKEEGDEARINKYSTQARRIYDGEKRQYVNFNFHDCNTNTGWFVYDDIMWWTCALARAYELFGSQTYLSYSESSFCRVFYGSQKVGDSGSYADPEKGLGGGMFWEWQPIDNPKPHKAGDFRSACINFPTVIAACRLHKLVPEGRTAPTSAYPVRQTKEFYLEKAIEIYEWANKTLVNNGRVADGIHGGGPEFKDHLYNQATYIGASCLLYKITGEEKYLNYAKAGANYVFRSMCASSILPLETGIEQGIYCAIFAQYMHMLIYDCGQTNYLSSILRNIQRGWNNRDKVRNISNGNFLRATAEGSTIESYPASALPALMLLFPIDAVTEVGEVPFEDSAQHDVFTLSGQKVKENATREELSQMKQGIYVWGNRKIIAK